MVKEGKMGTPLRMGLLAAVLLGGLIACSTDDDTTNLPPLLTIQAGNNQTDTVSQVLPDTLKVLLVDQNTLLPMSGQTVTWAVVSGGGTVDPTSSTTDANGVATTVWTLGPTTGAQTVSASVSASSGTPPDTFAATAVASQ